MSTGLAVFYTTVQETNLWLKQLKQLMHTEVRQAAYHALRATLHALRDRLGPKNAIHLGAQLPLLLRSVYYEGWHIDPGFRRARHGSAAASKTCAHRQGSSTHGLSNDPGRSVGGPPGRGAAIGGADLARRFGAAVVGMHVSPQLFVPVGLYGGTTGYGSIELIAAQRAANEDIRERIRIVFRDVCGDHADAVWRDAEGDPGRLIAEAARTADLVVTEKGDADAVDVFGTMGHLALSAGVPALMLPSGATPLPGQVVLVGWNGSREATRAVHGALPFLVGAKRVILCAVGEARHTLEDARVMLRRHEVAVEPKYVDAPDATAGEVMLAQACGEGVDLLVMGAYGHTRLRELVFGGATRHVLRAATLPVLFGG